MAPFQNTSRTLFFNESSHLTIPALHPSRLPHASSPRLADPSYPSASTYHLDISSFYDLHGRVGSSH
jgi:hypothetical protein